MPVTDDGRVGPEARPGSRRHRRGHLGAHGAVLARGGPRGRPAGRASAGSSRRPRRPVNAVRAPGDVGERGGDHPAGARLGRRAASIPAPASRSSTISASGRSSVENTWSPSSARIVAASASPAASWPGSARMSISISKLRAQIDVSTPGGSPPAVRWMSATCDSPMPYVRMSQRARGWARREDVGQRRVLGRVLPQPAELGRHARQDDDDRPVDGQDEARRGAGHPQHGRSDGHVRPVCGSRRRTPARSRP